MTNKVDNSSDAEESVDADGDGLPSNVDCEDGTLYPSLGSDDLVDTFAGVLPNPLSKEFTLTTTQASQVKMTVRSDGVDHGFTI